MFVFHTQTFLGRYRSDHCAPNSVSIDIVDPIIESDVFRQLDNSIVFISFFRSVQFTAVLPRGQSTQFG